MRTVAHGDALLAPTITRRLIEEFTSRPSPGPYASTELAGLDERELEILGAVAQGLSNAEIADSLAIAEATVAAYVDVILAKLGLRDRAQAVVVAYQTGLAQSAR